MNEKTQGAQIPWSAGKLDAPYFLFERAADAPPVVVAAAGEEAAEGAFRRRRLRGRGRSRHARRLRGFPARVMRARSRPSGSRRSSPPGARRCSGGARSSRTRPRAYWTYLRRYPHGPHANDAGWRLDALAARRAAAAGFRGPGIRGSAAAAARGNDLRRSPGLLLRRRRFRAAAAASDRASTTSRTTTTGATCRRRRRRPLAGFCRRCQSRSRCFDRPRLSAIVRVRDGRAPASAPPPPPRPFAPPPLPRGVQVQTRARARSGREAAGAGARSARNAR